MDNLVIFDWLSITSKKHEPADFMDMLGLPRECWQDAKKGRHGYKQGFVYNKIGIFYDGREDMGIFLDMSGQGCRDFESYGNGNYDAIFKLVEENSEDMKITRLDVAYDDHTGALDIDRICKDTLAQNFVSRFKNWQVVQGSEGSSVLHGSFQSEILIRIYDKAAEQGKEGEHWIRVELQLRRDRAMKFAFMNDVPIGERFAGVLVNYLRFVEPCETDSNKWRWAILDYWAQLLGDASRISLYSKPGTEYNLGNLQEFVINQAGNAIDAYFKIFGVNGLIESIRHRDTMPNPKYAELVRLWRYWDDDYIADLET